MLLKVGILIAVYLVIKTVCVVVNENEEIKFSIPKLFERISLAVMAFTSQIMFF